MPEALLPKLVIYPQSDKDCPCVIYGNRIGLQTLLAAINESLVKNLAPRTSTSKPVSITAQVEGMAYQVFVSIAHDRLFDEAVLSAPFWEIEPEDRPAPKNPSFAFSRLKSAVLAIGDIEWADLTAMQRAQRIITEYTRAKVKNRVTAEMLMFAMRKQPDWYQTAECHFDMTRAFNTVIDIDHPDTLVLRSDLDAANKRCAELEAELKAARAELLPI